MELASQTRVLLSRDCACEIVPLESRLGVRVLLGIHSDSGHARGKRVVERRVVEAVRIGHRLGSGNIRARSSSSSSPSLEAACSRLEGLVAASERALEALESGGDVLGSRRNTQGDSSPAVAASLVLSHN